MYAHTCTHTYTSRNLGLYSPNGREGSGQERSQEGSRERSTGWEGSREGSREIANCGMDARYIVPHQVLGLHETLEIHPGRWVRLSACLAGYPICLPRVGLIEGIWPGTIASDLDSSSVGGLWRSGRVSKPTETPQFFNISMRVCMCMYTHISLSPFLFFSLPTW